MWNIFYDEGSKKFFSTIVNVKESRWEHKWIYQIKTKYKIILIIDDYLLIINLIMYKVLTTLTFGLGVYTYNFNLLPYLFYYIELKIQ